MATIAVTDLPTNRALDFKTMSLVRGASAPWVFGWCTPWAPPVLPPFPVINFFQINNISVGQIVDQSQNLLISNSGSNSSITAVLIGSPSVGPSFSIAKS